MTNEAAFALGAPSGPMVTPIVSGRALANDHELHDCSRKTLEDPSGGLSLRVMP
jgi:hypothetical protein